jgi:hypothetical protein
MTKPFPTCPAGETRLGPRARRRSWQARSIKALALNCTLERSPDKSNTAALAQVVLDALAA